MQNVGCGEDGVKIAVKSANLSHERWQWTNTSNVSFRDSHTEDATDEELQSETATLVDRDTDRSWQSTPVRNVPPLLLSTNLVYSLRKIATPALLVFRFQVLSVMGGSVKSLGVYPSSGTSFHSPPRAKHSKTRSPAAFSFQSMILIMEYESEMRSKELLILGSY